MYERYSTLSHNQWVKEQITSEIRKHLEISENENATYQNLRGAATGVLTGTFTAVSANVKKQERTQIDNVTSHHRELVNGEQSKTRASGRKDIIKIRAEMNSVENRTTQKSS